MTNSLNDMMTELDALTTCNANCDPDPYAHPDSHFFASLALRDMLTFDDEPIDPYADALADAPDDEFIDPATYARLAELLTAIRADPYSREYLTKLALDNSLCPLHFHDYAICFDDRIPECAQIRIIHPDHDT